MTRVRCGRCGVVGVWAGGLEDAEQAAGEVALDLAWGLAFGEAAGGVGAGCGWIDVTLRLRCWRRRWMSVERLVLLG